MTHNRDTAMDSLLRYRGKDETLLTTIEYLSEDADDSEYDAVVGAVAMLSNKLPKAGPVLALEIIAAVGRLWARRTS